MNEETRPDNITANISGNVSGQMAVGKSIQQTQTIAQKSGVSEDDIATLRAQIAQFKDQIATQAPPHLQTAALERAGELEEALIAETPDLTTMDYVKKWFCKNIPAMAGAVTSIVINPIVGRLVQAAGDIAATQFKQLFGHLPKE